MEPFLVLIKLFKVELRLAFIIEFKQVLELNELEFKVIFPQL